MKVIKMQPEYPEHHWGICVQNMPRNMRQFVADHPEKYERLSTGYILYLGDKTRLPTLESIVLEMGMEMKMYGVNVIPRKCPKCGDIMIIGHFAPDTKNHGVWYWACTKSQRSNDCDGFIEIEKDNMGDIPPQLQKKILETDDEKEVQRFR